MTYWTDLYLLHDVDGRAIAGAVASALGVDPVAVAVAPYGTVEAASAGRRPGVTVLVQRQDLRSFGEGPVWPIELSIGLDGEKPDRELDALRAIAKGIDTPLIVSIDGDGQDMFRVVFPDGTALARLIDDDDNPILTDADRRRLARYDRPTSIAS